MGDRVRDEAAEAEVGEAVARTLARLQGVTELPVGYVPTTENQDGGYPFYRVERGRYLLLAHERGREVGRQRTRRLDTLLRWIFSSITSQMAQQWELHHRVEHEDSRRGWFPLWVDLMGRLDPAWGRRTQRQVDRILLTSPYVDRP